MVEFKYDIKLEDNTFQLREALEDWVKRVLGYWGMAAHPLSGCPSAVQLLEMIYNAVVRG